MVRLTGLRRDPLRAPQAQSYWKLVAGLLFTVMRRPLRQPGGSDAELVDPEAAVL